MVCVLTIFYIPDPNCDYNIKEEKSSPSSNNSGQIKAPSDESSKKLPEISPKNVNSENRSSLKGKSKFYNNFMNSRTKNK